MPKTTAEARYCSFTAPGSAPTNTVPSSKSSGIPQVKSSTELERVRATLAAKFPNHLLLFRGQNRCYPTVKSGLSRPEAELDEAVEKSWSVIAGVLLGDEGATHRSLPFRRALMQHYGLPTYYVDLTADVSVAAWFATNQRRSRSQVWGGEPPRLDKIIEYAKRDQGVGFVIVLAIPDATGLTGSDKLFKLGGIKGLVRPERQAAWLALQRQPLLPDPYDFWVDTVEIDCSLFDSSFTTSCLFPPPSDDPAYQHLLGYPYVQAPWPLLGDPESLEVKCLQPLTLFAEERGWHTEGLCIGRRAIAVPEYSDGGKPYHDHKWGDVTLYEPHSMRLWKNWSFELSDIHPGITGNISSAAKLTVSPRALKALKSKPGKARLAWPNLGNDDLLFTFSQYAYDKVDELIFPFEGVWLHREADLFIEHQVTAFPDVMNVHPGLTYTLVEGRLRRETAHSHCPCQKPRRHDLRVRAMLKLSSLIDTEHAAIIPHPSGIPDWYVVL